MALRSLTALAILILMCGSLTAADLPAESRAAADDPTTVQAASFAFSVPRISQDQNRPRLAIGTNSVPPDELIPPDPGPGANSAGASECFTGKACRTTQGYKCAEFAGTTCYTWVNADGLQRCAAC